MIDTLADLVPLYGIILVIAIWWFGSYLVSRQYSKDLELLDRHDKMKIKLGEELNVPKEDIANILPLGMKSKIVDRTNARQIIDMSHQRDCTRAYWEMRDLMHQIEVALSNYSEEWAYIIKSQCMPKCELFGYCNEGKKSCGRYPLKESLDNK